MRPILLAAGVPSDRTKDVDYVASLEKFLNYRPSRTSPGRLRRERRARPVRAQTIGGSGGSKDETDDDHFWVHFLVMRQPVERDGDAGDETRSRT